MDSKKLHRKHRKARFSSKFRGKGQSSVLKSGESFRRPNNLDLDVDVNSLHHVILLENGEIEAKWYGLEKGWKIEVSLFPAIDGIEFVKTTFPVTDKEVYLTD